MKHFAFTFVFAAALALSGLALSGCTTMDQWGQKQTVGTGVGGLAGGLAGSQIGSGSGRLWATGAGVLLGALVGSEVGASLDRADRAYMASAQRRAYSAPIGETITWSNPESGNAGTYTPIDEGRSSAGRYCREYRQTIYVGSRQEEAIGQACQNPDGTWEIVN